MTSSRQILIAALWMSGSIASFSAMAVAGRMVASELDTFETMLYRSLVGIVIVLVVGGFAGTLGQVTRRHMGIHFMRNLAHFSGQNLWFFAVTVAPLAQVFALEFTSPIWVLLLAPLVLGERLTSLRLIAGFIGFVGVIIVARPSTETLNWGVVTAAVSAVCFAFSIMFTKRLTRSESITCILFYLTTMQAVFGILCAGYDMDIALPSAQAAPWVALIACAGLLAHFCLTNALAIAPASIVSPIDFLRLPIIAIVGASVYQEAIDIWVIIGAILIFGANYLNIWVETRKKRVAA